MKYRISLKRQNVIYFIFILMKVISFQVKRREKMKFIDWLGKSKRIQQWTYIGLCALSLALICIYLLNTEEAKVERYFEQKYDVDVTLKYKEAWNMGNMGSLTHTVALKNNEHITFHVFVEDSKIVGDDYPIALENYEQYKKVEQNQAELNRLGFELSSEKNLQYIADGSSENVKRILKLKRTSKIDYATFEEDELGRFNELVKLLLKKGIDVHRVTIEDKQTPEPITISFSMREMKETQFQEDLFRILKNENLAMLSYYENARLSKSAKEIENERFRFKDQYRDEWLLCLQPDQKGGCIRHMANVIYETKGLTFGNPHLVSDVDAIFQFFKENLKPNPSVELNLTELTGPDTHFEPIRIEYKEWAQYRDTEKLLKEKIK